MKRIYLLIVCLFFLVHHSSSQSLPNQLSSPADVFVDATGNIYVADRENYRIQKWTPGASAGITVAGGNGSGRAANQLSYPIGVFVDATGNIYIADGFRIQKWPPGASAGITVAGGDHIGSAANELFSPHDVFVDVAGNIYIADLMNHRIQKWAPGASAGITVAGGNDYGSAANQLHYPQGVFVDVAGNIYVADRGNQRIQKWAPGASEGITVPRGNDAGSAAYVSSPSGVFVDATGNLYVTEEYDHRVQKWAPGASDGITVAGGNGRGAAANQLASPQGVFVDGTGNIYVADLANNRIQKWAPAASAGITVAGGYCFGTPSKGITVAGGNGQGSAANQLFNPSDVFVDVAGNIYVAEPYRHRIQKWAPGASAGITVAGGNGEGSAANQLALPYNIFVDANGNIFVADLSNHRIQKWAPGASAGITVAGGNGRGSAANQLAGPYGVFVDATGSIFVADASNHRIQKWAPGASAGITVAGGNGWGSEANQLALPHGIFVDVAGNIYVSDGNNYRIQKWAPGASAGITVAGGNGRGPSANQLNSPRGVFVDGTGNIYVADWQNYRIQKWAPGASAGITVAAGNGYGSAAIQLASPFGVFVDENANIYVADRDNNRIQKFRVPSNLGQDKTVNLFYADSTCTTLSLNGLDPTSLAEYTFQWSTGDTTSTIKVCPSATTMYRVRIDNGICATSDSITVQVVRCPANVITSASSCSDNTTVEWTEPRDTFPATFQAPAKIDPGKGSFTFIGLFNKHGYYKSTNTYLWPVARDITRLIGGRGVNGYLATLTSAEENNFIYNQVKGSGHSPWIGLFNTGRPGRFRWVRGGSLAYRNWAPGEPNNYGGHAQHVAEPYVQLLGAYGTWNDQRSDYLPFIAEFEKPLIRYRQISGIKNRSDQNPGVYPVCYTRRNLITDETDTCCFNVTVTCTDAVLTTAISSAVVENESAGKSISKGLSITASPNPSSHSFRLSLAGYTNERISLQVSDVSGRIVESRNGITPNQPIQIGTNYSPGIYFAQVIQGSRKMTVRLIKRSK